MGVDLIPRRVPLAMGKAIPSLSVPPGTPCSFSLPPLFLLPNPAGDQSPLSAGRSWLQTGPPGLALYCCYSQVTFLRPLQRLRFLCDPTLSSGTKEA